MAIYKEHKNLELVNIQSEILDFFENFGPKWFENGQN